MRQLLADKVCGTMVGLWLLVPEHLRLGTWDLLCGWTGQPGPTVDPRLALQLVHEAALCVTGVRDARSLSQNGFELINGLPFVATDQAVHDLLNPRAAADAQGLQRALGRLRRTLGHYQGRLLAIDPHALRSYSKRHTQRRTHKPGQPARKTCQSFFCLDAQTHQPVAFTTGSAARTVARATPELLGLAEVILAPGTTAPLVLADTEHFGAELLEHVARHNPFDLIVPMPNNASHRQQMQQLPDDAFRHRWAGLATAVVPYQFKKRTTGPLYQIVQRTGEAPDQYQFKGFLATAQPADEVQILCRDYPQRWHVEEFFNTSQALGWKRAGTLNMNIRYGQMTLALIAQTVLHQLRTRLGDPYAAWTADHLARDLLLGLDGDVRVADDTIRVTFYNAPHSHRLRDHYEHLPAKLTQQHVDPRVPWLYDFKLDFRFR